MQSDADVRQFRSDLGFPTTYKLELTVCDGEIFIPEGVGELKLVIPHRRDSAFHLKGMPDLYSLKVQNTFGDVPNSVCRIRIEQAPKLELIRLDTMQRFDLDVESAPQLDTLDGFSNKDGSAGARLTELNLSGFADLDSVLLNLTDLAAIELHGATDRLQLKLLRLEWDLTDRNSQNTARSVEKVQRLLTQLSVIRASNNMELRGLVCNHAILRDLPIIENALILNACIFQDDVVAESYGQFTAINHLNIEDLIATSQQISELTSCGLDTFVVDRRGEFRIDAQIRTAPPRMVDFTDWVFNPYYKMSHYLTELTEDANRTGKPGTFHLQISDLRYIAPGIQTLIQDARDSGVTVQINP